MKNRRLAAIACICRSFLYLNGFITEAENDRIHGKIRKWLNKKKVILSEKQIHSVDFIYKD